MNAFGSREVRGCRNEVVPVAGFEAAEEEEEENNRDIGARRPLCKRDGLASVVVTSSGIFFVVEGVVVESKHDSTWKFRL